MRPGAAARVGCLRVTGLVTIIRSTYSRRVLRVNGPIRLLADHDFTVRCIQVEPIPRGRWMVPLQFPLYTILNWLRLHSFRGSA